MRLSLLMAVMHVMGRLGIWGPYLRFIDMFLNYLDDVCYETWGNIWWDEGLFDVEEGQVITYES